MRTRSSKALLFGAWEGRATAGAPAFTLPLSLSQQAELALPRGGARPVLTLASEPEVVRGDGLHCPVVALRFLPLSPRSRRRPERRRENIAEACFPPPEWPPRSPDSPVSSASRRPAPR